MNTPSTYASNASSIRFGWIFGARQDMAFLFLPVFLAVVLFAVSQSSQFLHSALLAFVIGEAIGLSPFHLGSTWFHYFDKVNRAHYLSTESKRMVFFTAPLLIFLCSVALAATVPALAVLIFIGWSLQHLVRQNTGILLLYHNQKAGEAVVDRRLELNSQYASNVFFALIFANRVLLPPRGADLFTSLVAFLIVVALVVAVFCFVRYIIQLQAQVKEGALLNVPAFCFWILSVLWLSPLAFLGHSYYDAVLIPNVMHFAQYIGLNYQLVKNKYKPDQNIDALPIKQPILVFVLVSLSLVVIYNIIGIGCVFTQEQRLMHFVLLGALQGMGNVHYFQDAFIWRFREEFNRKAILPYLKTAVQSA